MIALVGQHTMHLGGEVLAALLRLPQLSSANQEAGEIMICVVDIFYRGFVHKEVHASGAGWYTEKNDAIAGTRAANRLKELGMLDELCDPLLRSGCARSSLLKGE